ncbi:uncharacterized protein GIQ15_04731 [Arthroderma uncinatum]|uniref:uncharacterized protein n=1 Tax=Arthroderma uncinatum TaxID=74035 RepID=UPI00144AB4BC|nr:uncharacterized protein GIQ15_04731 [Arthroderma uncinatum]KAF3481972.1 hypothetical protein GIQ15_04731 [Arthroderma uncinatum]
MSPPNKRRRIDGQFSPFEGQSQDFDVNQARKANDLRLKSRFESIFEKYGKDFSSVGDEIDLAKGTIVVDNGHLTEMGDEHDVGRGLWDDFHPEDESDEDNDAPGLDTKSPPDTTGSAEGGSAFFQEWVVQDDYNTPTENGDQFANGYGVGSLSTCSMNHHLGHQILNHQPESSSEKLDGDANLTTVTTPQKSIGRDRLFGHENYDTPAHNPPGDSIWDAPPIPTTALTTGLEDMAIAADRLIERTPSPDNSGSLWAAPHSRRKRIPRINEPKDLPKRTPIRKSKITINDSDSDDPIQDDTPISSTPKRPVNINTILSPKISTLQTPAPSKNIYNPSQEEPLPSLEHNDTNDVTINEQETASNPIMDTPLTNKPADPVTPTSLECTLEADNYLNQEVVSTSKKDGTTGADNVMDSPGAELLASKDLLDTLTPQEVKRLVTLRLVKRKPWREVSLAIPSRSNVQLRQWYYVYCSRNTNNFSASKPWTDAERTKLGSLAPETGDSWETIRSKFLNKSLEEIQHEWVKTCVGENLWESWVNSKTPSKAKKRSFPQEPHSPQTPIGISTIIASPLRPTTLPRDVTERPAAKETPSDTVVSREDRDESPDPLSEAFEKAWHGTGLSGVQISTPPRASRTPKKHLLSNSKSRSIIGL